MQDIKLIVSDLDGTILDKNTHEVNPIVFKQIEELKERGILFIAASGRQYENIQKKFTPVKDEIYYICENGCLSFINNQMINHNTLDFNIVPTIVNDILSHNNAEVTISGVHTTYTIPKNPNFVTHLTNKVGVNVTVLNNLNELKEVPMKVSIFQEDNLIDDAYWKNTYGSKLTVQTSGNCWLDMMPQGINKAYALENMLQELHINSKEVVAFGDNENDNEMLKLVGYPITMENSNPNTKPLSNYHTDEVYKVLEKILDNTFEYIK